MDLDTSKWECFEFDEIFDIKKGFYNKKPSFDDHGDIPFMGATDKNHGITGWFTREELEMSSKTGKAPNASINKKIFPANAVCVTNNGSVGYAYFIDRPFTCSHDVNPLYRKDGEFNLYTGLFIASIIMNERYRWGYGRKWRPMRMVHSKIKLPAKTKNQIKVPDWLFMERYIKSLNCSVPKTKNGKTSFNLNTEQWKNFLLKDLFETTMGNKIDAVTTTHDKPKYNYVSRNSNNNGVVDFVDEIDGQTPFNSGNLTIALGGSFLGSCFVQDKPFYTAQNVGVLKPKVNIDTYAKLFVSAIIRNEARIKYQAFGRELNSHFRTDFNLRLPVKRDQNDVPIVDEKCRFSPNGFIPDWKFMSDYIKSLPNGDLI